MAHKFGVLSDQVGILRAVNELRKRVFRLARTSQNGGTMGRGFLF